MRREGKEVQSCCFSFMVNEHISPGAEDGEVQGSIERW